MQYATENALHVGRNSASGRAALEGEAVHIPDVLADAEYSATSLREAAGYRTVLAVPLFRAGAVIGVFALTRHEVSPFSEKQIELVTTFAAQAVIAIENARLLNELRERTEEVEKLNQHLEQRVTDQVDEIERMSRLRRFLPPQVADLIVASGAEKQLESHRREITALFCDLRGFTGYPHGTNADTEVKTGRVVWGAPCGVEVMQFLSLTEAQSMARRDGILILAMVAVFIVGPTAWRKQRRHA